MPTIKMDMNPDDENLDTINDEEYTEAKEEAKSEQKEEAKSKQKEEEIDIPKPKLKRDNIKQEDIFAIEKSTQEGKQMGPSSLTKKGLPRKKRPPMTDEQKEKLKIAREKALEVRRKNAKEKLEMKELDTKEKELKKKQKYKKVKELEEEVVEDKPKTNNTMHNTQGNAMHNFVGFSKKDLEDANLEAIIKYDTIRKTRKKEKQEKIKKEQEEEVLKQTLRRAIAPQQSTNPFYGTCY